jgi:predicted glycogen debranching enzyme
MATRTVLAFGSQVCPSLSDDGGAAREWLTTDGTGGFASGTVAGLRTRRDHAFLVTPSRHVALVTLDPVLTLASGARVELATHEWSSRAVAPQGHLLLAAFDLTDGVPRWRWRIGDVLVERELAMAHGRPGVAVVHRIVAAPDPVRLSLAALCTWRPVGSTRPASAPVTVEPVAGGAVIAGGYRLAGPGWRPGGVWYLGARTRLDDDPLEDLWHAGTFTLPLRTGEAMEVSAWSGDLATPPPPASAVVAAARKRARRVVLSAKPADDIDAHLSLAADAAIVATPDGPDVVAGYPSGDRRSRDALISYEGLFLETGRTAEGRQLLRGYADRLVEGLLPVTPGGDFAAMDLSLWYAHAVERHVARTGDSDLAAELLPALDGIVDAHLTGTRYGIHADPADGLLTQAPEPSTLTWMDLRPGKPVEVNALWVNGLEAVSRLRESVGRDATEPQSAREAALTGFAKRFTTAGGWLYDLIDAPPPPYPLAGSQPYDDPVLRPNQVLAWSLPYGPLRGTDPGGLRAVRANLLTPLGPRTLAPTEYGYHGGPAPRDDATYQGAVRPWLIGPYVAACQAAGWPTDGLLDGLLTHVGEYGLGSVSELAAGDPPHRPGGAPFHACSVAELLRARHLLTTSRSRASRA